MIFRSTKRRLESITSKFDFDNIQTGDPPFVFIHIPKNAGTSIYKSLDIEVSRHYTVREYQEMLGPDTYNRLFSFAFVRNPFSRFVSLYNYARLEESYYHSSIAPEKAKYGKHLDYETLKDASLEDCARYLIEGKLVHNPPHNQWMPQVTWIRNNRKEIDITYLGRFEDLGLHWRNISHILNLKETDFPMTNSSGISSDYKNKISKETRTILEDYYSDDLSEFGYQF